MGVDRPGSGNGGVQWDGRSSVLTARGVQRAQQPQECEAQGRRHVGLEWAQEVPGGTSSHPGSLTSASQLLLTPHSPGERAQALLPPSSNLSALSLKKSWHPLQDAFYQHPLMHHPTPMQR